MAKYFMSGTKYEPFERMMMEQRKPLRNFAPPDKKVLPFRKGTREKQRSK